MANYSGLENILFGESKFPKIYFLCKRNEYSLEIKGRKLIIETDGYFSFKRKVAKKIEYNIRPGEVAIRGDVEPIAQLILNTLRKVFDIPENEIYRKEYLMDFVKNYYAQYLQEEN